MTDEVIRKKVEKAILLLPANPTVTDIVNNLMREFKGDGNICPLCNRQTIESKNIEDLKTSEIF